MGYIMLEVLWLIVYVLFLEWLEYLAWFFLVSGGVYLVLLAGHWLLSPLAGFPWRTK